MTFNTYNFVLYFMPCFLIGYFILGKKVKPAAAHMWLLAFSLLFCVSFGWKGTIILVGDVVVNYFLSLLIERTGKKLFFISSILVNILTLLILKYLGFFASIGSFVLKREISVGAILIPLGISYITLRQISYVTDVYRKELKVPDFLGYANYCLYFPMMLQGPLTSAADFLPQIDKNKKILFNEEDFAKGLWWFSIGLFKKMFFADTLAKSVLWYFANYDSATSIDALLCAIVYCFQLYFDFSGYCDMAAGISKMIGIDLPQNFDSPYKSTSVSEIWRRWHATLMQFMQKYIYFPLGGSRNGALRTYINIIIVFLVSGLWHGAAWTYVVWGLFNGLAQCIERIFKKQISYIPKPIRWFITQAYWCINTIFFSSVTVGQAFETLKKIFINHNYSISKELLKSSTMFELEYIENHLGDLGLKISMFHLPMFLIASAVVVYLGKNLYEKEFKPTAYKAIGAGLILFWCILSMGGITTFLYAIY